MLFETRECTNLDIVKELFIEYSHIKGAESCFVSFDKELNECSCTVKKQATENNR